MKPLLRTESAARLLDRLYRGVGFSAGPDFPGNTIRKAIDRLVKLGYYAYTPSGAVTPTGRAWLFENSGALL